MLINKALLKYGFDSFLLEILEYCEESVIIEREQYYLDSLMAEYNILKIAGSLKDFKHSEETKLKMSQSKKGFKHSKETLAKRKKHTEETKNKIRKYKHSANGQML